MNPSIEEIIRSARMSAFTAECHAERGQWEDCLWKLEECETCLKQAQEAVNAMLPK